MRRHSFPAVALALAVAGPASATLITQDFDNPGTSYTTQKRPNASQGAQVITGGPSGSFLKVTTLGDNDSNNRLQFDPVVAGASYTGVVASFDFRIGTFPDKGADGFAFVLLNTADYPSGAGSVGETFEWEEPNLANSLAVGFDYYDGDGPVGERASNVSVHYNFGKTAEANTFDSQDPGTGDITGGFSIVGSRGNQDDLRASPLIRADLVIDFVPGGAYVDLVLTPDASVGAARTIFSDLFVGGVTPYDAQVVLAGRTGGLAGGVELDNISVNFVPEPASLALLAVGAAAVMLRRKA